MYIVIVPHFNCALLLLVASVQCCIVKIKSPVSWKTGEQWLQVDLLKKPLMSRSNPPECLVAAAIMGHNLF